MVRYPQKNPSEPAKPQSEAISSKIIDDKKISNIKDPKDKKVEELQQRLHFLEEKLIDMQKQNQAQASDVKVLKGSYVNFLRKYQMIFILVFIVFIMGLMVWLFVDHLYVSTFALELNPKEFNLPDEQNPSDSSFVSLETPPSLMEELAQLNLVHIKTVKNGKFIGVRIYSLGLENSREKAENWKKNFIERYVAYRKNLLTIRLNLGSRDNIKIHHQLEDVFEQMSDFKPNEEYFLINESSKEKLIQLTQSDALDLEKDFMDMKDQLSKSNKEKILNQWSPEDKVLLETYRLKLTEMEFKKFLVVGDFVGIYEEGMRTVKTAAAQLINDEAKRENLDDISASLIIKDFFLNCRENAMEALLNKRFIIGKDELSGRLARYFSLKGKFDALNLKLEDSAAVNRQIKRSLAKGFAKEVIDYAPLNVDKY